MTKDNHSGMKQETFEYKNQERGTGESCASFSCREIEDEREQLTRLLLETGSKLRRCKGSTEVILGTVRQLSKLLGRDIIFFTESPENDAEPMIFRRHGSELEWTQDERELETAKRVYDGGMTGEQEADGAAFAYRAVGTEETVLAVLGISVAGQPLQSFERELMKVILNEASLVLQKEALDEERRAAAARLEKEQLRASLLRMISHDLRTPLTSISGNASLLMESEKTLEETQKREIYRDIYEDSVWLIGLVENLLSVTRLENGTMQLHLQPELISELIEEAVKHVERQALGHSVIIEESDAYLMAEVDGRLFVQVLVNLLSNAVKYTKAGSEIRICAEKEESNLKIQVADDGPGIAGEDQEHIFEMFYTAGQQVKDGRRGLGLGLALCRDIIEAHGGSISVRNRSPHGALFEIIIKAKEVALPCEMENH